MNKIINFILWPAIAGLVFALILLQMPRAVSLFPGLAAYFPAVPVQQPQIITQTFVNTYNEAYKIAAPAVVSINSQQINSLSIRSEDIQDESTSLGSGVIISPDGFIITSYHVVYTPGTIRINGSNTVTLNDGRNLVARPVLLDEANDLALLKMNADNLPYIGLATQSTPNVGDVVLAIGNPRNIGQSVSMGIVSALKGDKDNYLIQTDAAINPGNSGGALVDIKGKLLGINSTIVSESGGSEGIGFATPANKVQELLESYINGRRSGYLGVDSEAFTVIDGLRKFNQVVQGLLVQGINDNSPAAAAGIQVGDIITGVNGIKLRVTSAADIVTAGSLISSHGSGEEVTLEIFRNDMTNNVPVILGVGEPNVYFLLPDEEELKAESNEEAESVF